MSVTREEFEALKESVDALRERVSNLHPTVDEHDYRLDEHGRQLDDIRREMRVISTSVGRLTDLVTPLSMSLPRVERNITRVLELLEPRKVIVDGTPGQ